MQKSSFFLIFFMFYNIFFCFVILFILIHCEPLEVASLPVYAEMTFVADWYKTFGMVNLIIEELVTIVMQ